MEGIYRPPKCRHGSDRLSELPDGVIVHILSFLPTLDAVRTVLLRRFGNLWTLVPTLDFREAQFSRQSSDEETSYYCTTLKSNFTLFVRNVLILHKRPTIDKFTLCFEEDICWGLSDSAVAEVGMWIRFALSRDVKAMMLFFYGDDYFPLPVCIYTSQSLVMLKLTDCKIDVPSRVHMGSLRTLDISRFVVDDIFNEFVVGCPALKELAISLHAEVYANGRAEEIMGQAIRELGWKRSDIVVSTKIFWGGSGPNDKGLSRKHIVEGTRASLKRLDMEYVDVIYCHRPDSSTPIEETVRAMNYVIDKGWAFYWGTSEWSSQQITEAWAAAHRLDLVGPIVEQPEYNLLSRHKVESEYLPLYSNYGIGLTTWSPLASGVLTGKYNKGTIPPDSRFALENYKNLASRSLVDDVLKKVNGLKPIADELGVPLSQLAIAWCAANPNVSSVITGATRESQIEENMKAVDVIPKLTPAVMEKIEAVVQSKPKRPESYR